MATGEVNWLLVYLFFFNAKSVAVNFVCIASHHTHMRLASVAVIIGSSQIDEQDELDNVHAVDDIIYWHVTARKTHTHKRRMLNNKKKKNILS